MTHKQIEAAREVRLWIGQIVVPAVTTAAALMTIPEIRAGVTAKVNEVRQSIRDKYMKD